MGTPTLPSAMHHFTAEFGMGSGGTNALMPPGKLAGRYLYQPRERTGARALNFVSSFKSVCVLETEYIELWCYMTKSLGQLVLVSFTHYCASTPSLSTS